MGAGVLVCFVESLVELDVHFAWFGACVIMV